MLIELAVETDCEGVIQARSFEVADVPEHVVAFEEEGSRDVAREGIAEAEGDEVNGVVDLPVWEAAAGMDLYV